MIEKSWPFAEKLITDISDATAKLHQQLAQEAELLLTGQQAELIDACTIQKKRLATQLEELNSQFGQLLGTEQLPCNQEGINLYFQRAEASGLPTGPALSNWQQLQQLCIQCKTLNDQNGASIELLSIHAKRSLDILKGKTRTANTYGRNGTTQSESLNHTLAFYL
jgi:flagellar biosynthesis protein FlgN